MTIKKFKDMTDQEFVNQKRFAEKHHFSSFAKFMAQNSGIIMTDKKGRKIDKWEAFYIEQAEEL